MKKKLFVGFLLTLLTIGMVGCGASNDVSKDESSMAGSGETKKASAEDFVALTEVYFEKQQALMMKQSEGQSDDFEVVSQHAKDVINSDEYKAWEAEAKKMDELQLDADEEKVKELTELQDALKEYNEIQADYFNKLAEAADKEAYNQVNTDLADKLDASQNKLIDLMNTIDL
ncbi:hypothetical protein LI951_04785 [Enterococcus sp. BWT-B8]|uniref:hypothetical protein n=1 Tax=Enterococcus sp. BWT-B8 TaxID=2885157 RepID=UPI001E648F84|nr:hypothetical protein [Enterococcus sp. BWT-B8]MCB5951373.1 hypothetical protein [Enterococcus sp. BWT-B8]